MSKDYTLRSADFFIGKYLRVGFVADLGSDVELRLPRDVTLPAVLCAQPCHLQVKLMLMLMLLTLKLMLMLLTLTLTLTLRTVSRKKVAVLLDFVQIRRGERALPKFFVTFS